jgi:hypothetical protein
MRIAAEDQPENPKLAFDAWDTVERQWVRRSWDKMNRWNIWRYSTCRSIPEFCDLVPSDEMVERALGYLNDLLPD